MTCDECIHNNICKIKEDFIGVKDTISKMNVKSKNGKYYQMSEIDFLKPIEINCRYFYAKSTNVKEKNIGRN